MMMNGASSEGLFFVSAQRNMVGMGIGILSEVCSKRNCMIETSLRTFSSGNMIAPGSGNRIIALELLVKVILKEVLKPPVVRKSNRAHSR